MPLWLGWGKLFLYHYLDNNVFRNIITTIILIFIIIIISSVKRGKWNHLKIIQKLSKNIPGMHVKELRKTAILATAHLVRKE